MLEQEFQNQEIKQPEISQPISPESELFEQYEIKSWNFSPRLYQIMAVSAIFNILALVVFAQTNLLTRKGCDSPLVSQVCQVLDTVYLGRVLIGTDTEYISKDYEKTELEDVDITYIDTSGQTPPLNYPEGYFALANPESVLPPDVIDTAVPPGFEMPPSGSTPIPGFPSSPMPSNNDLSKTIPNLPPPMKNNPISGPMPSSPLGGINPIAGNPKRNFPGVKNNRPKKNFPNESPDTLPDLDDTAENKKDPKAQTEPKQPDISSMPVAENVINKKPLQDFGEDVLDKVNAKTIDLNKPFMVVMQGTINKDGKFDPKKSGYTKLDGDAEMINVAKDAIEAIGDSGILTYLTALQVEKVSFTLVQDDKQIYAVISSDQKTDNKAKLIASGLNGFISAGKLTVKEEDTLILLKAATVENQGKSFVLNFKIDKPIAQELIKRQLDKAQAKRQQQPQPNGTADTKNANTNAVK